MKHILAHLQCLTWLQHNDWPLLLPGPSCRVSLSHVVTFSGSGDTICLSARAIGDAKSCLFFGDGTCTTQLAYGTCTTQLAYGTCTAQLAYGTCTPQLAYGTCTAQLAYHHVKQENGIIASPLRNNITTQTKNASK